MVGGGGVLAGEMALGFAGAGANMVIADLNEENAQQHTRAFCAQGRQCVVCQADVSIKPDVRRFRVLVNAIQLGFFPAERS